MIAPSRYTSGGNCGGAVTADSHNLADDGTCGSATQATSAQINLQPLASNGGSTQTMALGELSSLVLDSTRLTPEPAWHHQTEVWLRQFDPVHGGFGGAPKFPHETELEFCLRQHALSGDSGALVAARIGHARQRGLGAHGLLWSSPPALDRVASQFVGCIGDTPRRRMPR